MVGGRPSMPVDHRSDLVEKVSLDTNLYCSRNEKLLGAVSL